MKIIEKNLAYCVNCDKFFDGYSHVCSDKCEDLFYEQHKDELE